jgi:hypothetical protein
LAIFDLKKIVGEHKSKKVTGLADSRQNFAISDPSIVPGISTNRSLIA